MSAKLDNLIRIGTGQASSRSAPRQGQDPRYSPGATPLRGGAWKDLTGQKPATDQRLCRSGT